MERYSAAPLLSHPPATLKWHLTPSCVYIRPWKWEIVMSHSGCVYTPESRKEGNQPRSAKSGEVRENSCSAAELQWFTSARQDLSHVISTAETFDQHKTATVMALSTGMEKKRQRRRQKQQELVWNQAITRRELNFLLNIFTSSSSPASARAWASLTMKL